MKYSRNLPTFIIMIDVCPVPLAPAVAPCAELPRTSQRNSSATKAWKTGVEISWIELIVNEYKISVYDI